MDDLNNRGLFEKMMASREPRKRVSPNMSSGRDLVSKISELKNEFDLKDLQEEILDLVENNRSMTQYEIADRIRMLTSSVRSDITHLVMNLSSMMQDSVKNMNNQREDKGRKMNHFLSKLSNKVEFQKQENGFLKRKNNDLVKRLKYVKREVKRLEQKLQENDRKTLLSVGEIDSALLFKFTDNMVEKTRNGDENQFDDEIGEVSDDDEYEENDEDLLQNQNKLSKGLWEKTMKRSGRKKKKGRNSSNHQLNKFEYSSRGGSTSKRKKRSSRRR